MRHAGTHRRLAKVAFSAAEDCFVVNQSFGVLSASTFVVENRHLAKRQNVYLLFCDDTTQKN